ncbi:hypothetical protein THAOC_29118 [Thalassiosira oceanica]|uniref:FAD synthase n=1 Tax=Thalassiosira oceanica TaxID=159749 RepID=K0RS43_THAOC|nr:hypothetical protein THAOC_29118 [Thalassiosira oceanica]|eukprot:EJK51691.1 hypothetical protein THAOC_29118 [Thalassiosira oceanica]
MRNASQRASADAIDASHLPNWRVVDTDEEDGGAASFATPFCHRTGDEPSQAIAASWSRSAHQSALELYVELKACTDEYISPFLQSTLSDLEMAYRLYGPYCMVGSYNGGKDAVVIFHLMRAVHAHFCEEMRRECGDDYLIPRPRTIYFQHEDEFPEVELLLEETVVLYDLDMQGVSYSSGSSQAPPHPLAFILGTRSDDPNAGGQGVYAPSSSYMPPFLRVNPILNWTYGHVWHFLRLFDLPYCSLYDDGYTSLGTVKDTLPCPALKKSENSDEYWPAYMLRDWDQERAGRINKKSKTKSDKSVADKSEASSSVNVRTTMSKAMNKNPSVGVSLDNTQEFDNSTVSTVGLGECVTFMPLGYQSHSKCPVVVGDELLKGLTPDSNIIAAAKALRSNGLSLLRVSIVSDDLQVIADELRRVSKEVDIIVTSGGVGPTHDDVTIKSVAMALGLDLEHHEEMAELLLDKMGSHNEDASAESIDDPIRQLSAGQRKMSMLPKHSELKYLSSDSSEWPVLQFFERKIKQLAPYIVTRNDDLDQKSSPPARRMYRIVLSLEEDGLVAALNDSVAANPNVCFGSYPVDHEIYKTIITVEARSTGGYTKGTTRLLERSRGAGKEADAIPRVPSNIEFQTFAEQSIFFSEEDMAKNLADALHDIQQRLPRNGILFIDSSEDLRIK